MATVITAGNATNGLSFTADNTGAFQFKTGTGAGTTAITVDSSQVVTFAGAASVPGNLSFNSGYGSAAVAYGCRAWVNFNGTGTVAIRASGNVTSITDNGTGDYTMNFTNAMPDINYCPAYYIAAVFNSVASVNNRTLGNSTRTTSGFRFQTTWTSVTTGGASVEDLPDINIAIFR